MSDYMFMLESHLSPEQNQAVTTIEAAAANAGVPLFLTGGAMRDMLGGFPIRDLDFTVEGNAVKLARAIVQANKTVRLTSTDDLRKSAELVFPGGATASISSAHQAHYPKPACKPQVEPATIHEDLRGRDFTVNAMALSLSRASRGLILDPTNGQGDLERRELRTASNYALYDDPSRLLRLLRLKARLGYEIEERTASQFENVIQAELEQKITSKTLLSELQRMADEPNPGELLELLAARNLLALFSPVLTAASLNSAGFTKLQKARMLVPFEVTLHVDNLALFLFLLTEKLSQRERSQLASGLGMDKGDVQRYQRLEANAKKLEKSLKSAKLKKPSLVFQAMRDLPGELILFLLMRSNERLVVDRIKNYLQKYMPAALEVTDKEPELAGIDEKSPKFRKAKDQLIFSRLDARPKKPAPEEVPATPPAPGPPGRPAKAN